MILISFIMFLSVSSSIVSPLTYTVCNSGCDYASIQEGVSAAIDGDFIEVLNGTYKENVYVDKQLIITARDGPLVTTVSAANPNNPIFLIGSNLVKIRGFTITGSSNSAGIYLNEVNYCSISNNNISGNQDGIYFQYSHYNTVKNNNISLNTNGIHLYASNLSTIKGNTLKMNGYGINIKGPCMTGCHNKIYHNNFINSTVYQAYSESLNSWDNSYGGNFWSDLTSPDENGDGIVDAVYNISGFFMSGKTNQDHYPFVSENGWLPNVIVYTDKYNYTTNDTMNLTLNITNPDAPITVDLYLYLEFPSGENVSLWNRSSAILPSKSRYSKSKSYTLPSMTPGTYAWHAILYDSSTEKILSESAAPWTFIGAETTGTRNAFGKVLQRAYGKLDFYG